MATTAAVCPVHGPVPTSGIVLSGVDNATLIGNRVSCPEPGCTELALVMEGKYNFDAEGRAEPIDVPEWSRAALEAVQGPLMRINEAVNSDISNADLNEVVASQIEELRTQADDELVARIADVVQVRVMGEPRTRSRVFMGQLLGSIGRVVEAAVATEAYAALRPHVEDLVRLLAER